MLTYWEKHLQAVRSDFEMYLSAGSRLSSLGGVLPEQPLRGHSLYNRIPVKWFLEILFPSTLFVIIYQDKAVKGFLVILHVFVSAVLIFSLNITPQCTKNKNIRA